jgi:hypothetical protein
MVAPGDQTHRFVIHDRDTIYSDSLDRSLEAMGLEVLNTPVRVPRANAFCERLIGTIRRECLDFVIPMTEHHLRVILREWIRHYNRGRPHSLGPGLPDPRGTEWSRRTATNCPSIIESSRRRLCEAFITNTTSSWPRERRHQGYLRRTGGLETQFGRSAEFAIFGLSSPVTPDCAF